MEWNTNLDQTKGKIMLFSLQYKVSPKNVALHIFFCILHIQSIGGDLLVSFSWKIWQLHFHCLQINGGKRLLIFHKNVYNQLAQLFC